MSTKHIFIAICLSIGVVFSGVAFMRVSSHTESEISTDNAAPVVVSGPSFDDPKKSEQVIDPIIQTPIMQGSSPKSSDPLHPTHLSIPSLGIETFIQEVGVTSSGNMATPSNYTDVGWYKYGTIPGEEGSAVIAGHRSNALFLPAVFFTLKNISVGDSVYVTNGAGKKMHFIVREIETYDYTQVPLQELFHEGGAPLLKLITCEGPWLQKDKTARERRIVTAVLQE